MTSPLLANSSSTPTSKSQLSSGVKSSNMSLLNFSREVDKLGHSMNRLNFTVSSDMMRAVGFDDTFYSREDDMKERYGSEAQLKKKNTTNLMVFAKPDETVVRMAKAHASPVVVVSDRC